MPPLTGIGGKGKHPIPKETKFLLGEMILNELLLHELFYTNLSWKKNQPCGPSCFIFSVVSFSLYILLIFCLGPNAPHFPLHHRIVIAGHTHIVYNNERIIATQVSMVYSFRCSHCDFN